VNQPQQPLVLASTSRYRRQLLSRLKLQFEVAKPHCDETPLAGESPEAMVLRLAVCKARSLAGQFPSHVIIGSDQVANLDGVALGKPGSLKAAVRQLQRQSGRSIVFYTGLCVLDTAQDQVLTDTAIVKVRFRTLTTREIQRYVNAERPLDCAGSFKSEGLGIALFDAIETTDPSALIGLPLIQLAALLRQCGFELP